MIEINKIYNMDCVEGLKLLDDNSIDSIVTDPPYELGFMGKKWDATGIAHNIDLWKECLRVLKPGGHLLAFGGTRTYHRMTCAIEDAGFEIRDQIQWIYGSGFPKSLDISKVLDKKAGVERPLSSVQRPIGGNKGVYEWQGGNWGETVNIPQTDFAKQYSGCGTALKPANEPIVVARKPLSEKTVAENVLKWGTGGINIDDCRINLNGEKPPIGSAKRVYKSNQYTEDKIYGENKETSSSLGRFPANVILDEEAGKMLDEQSGISKSIGGKGDKSGLVDNPSIYGTYSGENKGVSAGGFGDSGGASRFFYCAKTSKKERGEGNNHPTVKPISLIKYLVTLVTPPNGICLDPFEGSGTHALACEELGFNYLGFELSEEYCEITNKRIQAKLSVPGRF